MKRIPYYINCYLCFREFRIKPSRKNGAKFCSQQCMDIYYSENGFSKERKLKMSKKAKKRNQNMNWINQVSKTWFKKGNIPWNKNKSVRLSPNSEFKKGHIPIYTPFKRINGKPTWSKEIEIQRIKKIIISNKKTSKPELKVNDLLHTLDLKDYKHVGQGKFFIEQLCPDFVNKSKKKIIEVFGDYWHNLPKSKKRDYFRFKLYKKYKYQTLVIWEHELKDLDYIAGKILEFEER